MVLCAHGETLVRVFESRPSVCYFFSIEASKPTVPVFRLAYSKRKSEHERNWRVVIPQSFWGGLERLEYFGRYWRIVEIASMHLVLVAPSF